MGRVYAIVDRPDEVAYRQTVMTLQKKKIIVDGETHPEVTDELSPNAGGLYIVGEETHPFFDARCKAMKRKMERENLNGKAPRIVGPFDDDGEEDDEGIAIAKAKRKSAIMKAMIAQAKARPLTDAERAHKAEAALSKKDSAFEAEKATLLAEIEALKKAKAPTSK